MADRISTKPGIIAKSDENENTPTGNRSTITWVGSYADCLSQRSIDQHNGASYTKLTNNNDGTYQLLSTWNYDLNGTQGGGGPVDLPVNIHDLEITMETVSAYNSPKLYASLLTAFAGTDSSVKAALAKVQLAEIMFKNPTDNGNNAGNTMATAQETAEAAIATLFPSNSTAQALMISLFRNVALMGQQTVVQFNNVYRRSITAATPVQVRASRTGEGKIWTSDEIVKFENLPQFWWFGLPTGLQWLKVPANVNLIAGGKTRIDYYYMGHQQASGLHYDAYDSATLLP